MLNGSTRGIPFSYNRRRMRRAAAKTYAYSRDLEDGWDYSPQWRALTVDALLQQGVASPPLTVLHDEEDTYVREYYRFRRQGRCFLTKPFTWAHNCHASNSKTGAGSLIKSLVLAHVPFSEIAQKLRTTTAAIAVYTRLFWEVLPYVDGSGWIHALVFSPLDRDAAPWEVRERNLLAAALIRGQQGVGNLFSPSVRLSSADRNQRLADIQSALTHRASEWLTRLELEGVPPGPQDLASLIRVTDVLSRNPDQEDSKKTMRFWMASLHGTVTELANSPEFATHPKWQWLRDRNRESTARVPQKVLTW